MKKLRWLGAAWLVLALALVGSASGSRAIASYQSAELDVSGPTKLGASGTTTIHVAIASTDDPTAKLTFFAPAGTGALVDGVLCGTPADQAGLFAGDVITSVGGQPVTSPRSLTALVGRYHPGSRVALAWVAPGGSLHTARVTLAAGPAG